MKKKIGKGEAKEKIKELINLAGNVFNEDKKKANEYVRKARNLAMRFRLKFDSRSKKKFCKHCHGYLKPGVNCRVRTREGKLIYYCLECKKHMRFPLRNK